MTCSIVHSLRIAKGVLQIAACLLAFLKILGSDNSLHKLKRMLVVRPREGRWTYIAQTIKPNAECLVSKPRSLFEGRNFVNPGIELGHDRDHSFDNLERMLE